MISFLEKLGNKLEPLAAKLAGNKVLTAIKEGFIVLMPLLIIGSFAIVLNNVVLSWGENSLWYNLGIHIDPEKVKLLAEYKIIGDFVWQGTLAIVGLLVSFTIAYSYSRLKSFDGLSAGVISLGAFMAIQIWEVTSVVEGGTDVVSFAVNPNNLGTTNIVSAMLVAIISAKVYCWFMKKNMVITMPEGVPPGVIKAFQALIPGTVILFGFAIIAAILQVNSTEISVVIGTIIAEPLKKIGSEGPLIAYIYVTLSNLLYFFGIHGANVLSFVDATIFTPASIENANMIAAGTNSTLIFSKGMLDSFVFLGGGGATLALIISIFAVGKKKSDRAIAKYASVPALFNINEPLVFGLPIVMNPILFIPFILAPPILMTTAWLQIILYNSIGLLENVGSVLIPWISPLGIGAFIGYQSFWAVLIAITQLAIAVIIYLPFVFAMNSIKEKNV